VKHFVPFIAAAVVALSFFNPPRPAADGPVATALASATPSDRAKVAGIYRALADVTGRDSGRLIATTATWRLIHADALRLAVGGTPLVGKYPGLDTAVESVLSKHFTLDNVALTSQQDGKTVAERIVQGCREVERQCGRR
jgi:hypothetical protein